MSRGLSIGVVVPNYGRDAVTSVRQAAARAEEWGYDSLWLTDHVVGFRDERARTALAWLEALTCVAYLAGATSRVRLGLSVLVAAYRDPVVVAKMLATADRLSDGRVLVGVGAGWSQREFRALGQEAQFRRRQAVTDACVDILKRCWAGGDMVLGDGRGSRELHFMPTPVHGDALPLFVAGRGRHALRRACRHATAWHPTGLSPADVGELGDRLDRMAGRPVPRFPRVRMPSVDDAGDALASYQAHGCSGVIVELTPVADTPWSVTAEAFAARWVDDGRFVGDAL